MGFTTVDQSREVRIHLDRKTCDSRDVTARPSRLFPAAEVPGEHNFQLPLEIVKLGTPLHRQRLGMDSERRERAGMIDGRPLMSRQLEPKVPVGRIPERLFETPRAQGGPSREQRRGHGDEVLDQEPFDEKIGLDNIPGQRTSPQPNSGTVWVDVP